MTNADAGDLLLRLTEAMDGVIEDEDLPEVAGFKIKVYFDGKQFVYEGYLDTYFPAQQMQFHLTPGAMVPITHANAAQGGYTINFFNSRDNYNYVGLHVKQGNFGIVFERKNHGLLYPHLLENTDELDFLDAVKEKYKIWPSGTTQSATEKFGNLGKQYFDQKNYSAAIDTYSQGLKHLFSGEKATFYFNIAICQIHLNNIPSAIENFSEAVKLDPNRQREATKIMQSVFSSRK
ncbi:tetratricopeptide repeat protein [Mucilaginibacter sp. P19]|uniref:tetratricopeptide repeat protein n=1 Tax=Mucilaginibacter sp. P19 TaxID=3423947 RepID=UPI003D6695EC